MFFQVKLYTRQRVISQLKCVSVMTSWDVFRGKRFRVFHFMWRPLLLFTLAICDLFTPSFRLCWSLLHLYVQKKKEKSPWLKVKKKIGPKKKKKKVFDDEWRKTLADNDKVIMGVMGLTQLLSTCNAQFRVWLELVYLLGICPFCTKQLGDP